MARAWDGHEVVDLAVGRLALHYAEENPDEVVAALDDKTEAVIRGLEAQPIAKDLPGLRVKVDAAMTDRCGPPVGSLLSWSLYV